MAENLHKQPKRGILKASTSFEQREHDHSSHPKNPHFDEQNILATFHPPDKDYGFMKIEEPKTPYEYGSGDEEDEEEKLGEDGVTKASAKPDELDANLLAAKIASDGAKGPRPRRLSEPSADEEDLQLLSPEERDRRKSFEAKRKMHYNEFYAVKMARQLMEQEGGEDEEEENGSGSDANKERTPDEETEESNESAEAAGCSSGTPPASDTAALTPAASPMDTAEGSNV